MNLNIRNDISGEIASPTLLAGWPGMGSVGVGAVNYLRRHLEAVPFADVDMTEFFCHEEVVVEDGIAQLPAMPNHVFYHVPDRDLIIFESEAQVGGEGGIALMNRVLDLAQQLDVQAIYTAAAYAIPMRHSDDVHVLGISNRESMRDHVVDHGIEVLEQGRISGLNGLLLGFADSRGISAACLLATMPHQLVQMPNPRASRGIINILTSLLDVEVDLTEMDEAVEEMGRVIEEIEQRIRSAFSSMEGEGNDSTEELTEVDEETVPAKVMERIERMFLQFSNSPSAQQSRVMAQQLKEELDKWDLYGVYEDRFLNLFRDQ
ncbi:MAG: hypothetical protein CME19_12535 [Gemmatimonadetes bacterium]|nr:hypothetical protein [Gemmatimonadota bacterium]|tara:strand:- start:126 stop:1082 length:957 start_codon:yes stop_codon:yes gene_type:complete